MQIDDRLGPDGDAFYTALVAAHEGLTDAQSQVLNARLVLILGNEIGDIDRLRELLAAAGAMRRP